MLVLEPIKLKVKRSVINDFKTLAKKAYPNEAFSVLIGHDCGTLIEVVDLYTPENIERHTTKYGFDIKPEWWFHAYEKAKEEDLTIVGDIHSHCFDLKESKGPIKLEPTPSELDLIDGLLHISGICLITQGVTGKLRSRIRMWGPQVRVDTEIIK